jgi:outer membrane receptor protein involved in Fe transport
VLIFQEGFMSIRVSLLAAAVASALGGTSAPAIAQQGVAVGDDVEVISVTGARRREEAAQDVPIPISSISGELLERPPEVRAPATTARISATRAPTG